MNEREPCKFEGRFLWHPVPAGVPLEEQTDYLPLKVFRRLAGYIQSPNPQAANMVRAYPTRTAAMLAFEQALIETILGRHIPTD